MTYRCVRPLLMAACTGAPPTLLEAARVWLWYRVLLEEATYDTTAGVFVTVPLAATREGAPAVPPAVAGLSSVQELALLFEVGGLTAGSGALWLPARLGQVCFCQAPRTLTCGRRRPCRCRRARSCWAPRRPRS
jgi:hypothetical protein